MNSETPPDTLSWKELETIDSAAYVSELRKIDAHAVGAVREASDRSWKVCATVAAIVFGSGFTDAVQNSADWVEGWGIAALSAWLAAMVGYLSVGVRVFRNKAVEQDTTGMTNVRKREEELAAHQDVAFEAVTFRSHVAVVASLIALACTIVALVGVLTTRGENGDNPLTGRLGFTEEGTAAVLTACSALDETTLAAAQATVDVNKLGLDEPVDVYFAEGVCSEAAVTVWIDGEQILVLADP